MKAFENAAYRLGLAEGFLGEAEQDLALERWDLVLTTRNWRRKHRQGRAGVVRRGLQNT